MTRDSCRGGHEDRAQPRAGGFGDRGESFLSGLLKVIGELHDEDAVLRDETHQRNQSDLAVDVEGRQAEKRKHERPRQRQRHGAREDHERVAEAFELGRENEVDQYRGQQKRTQEGAALDTKLPGLPGIVKAETLRQDGPGLAFEKPQGFVERHSRGITP
jgi:hypothetical protein